MQRSVRLAPLVALVASAFVALEARASESYPPALDRALDMHCPPACTLCHTTATGGTLTANTPVGVSMRRAGLECCATSLLYDAIATLEAEATDSDMDGAPDVDELRAGTDPNGGEGKLACLPPEPEESCAVTSRSSGVRGSALWAIGAALALVTLARRRRARPR